MDANLLRTLTLFFLILVAALSGGCATAPAEDAYVAGPDPIEPANRKLFAFDQALDRHVVKPVAEAYVKITPRPVRAGVTNFFDNLGYLNVILNDFLQAKFSDGFSDVGRFVVNSTMGIGGLFDVATDMGLPRHEEDLGQTLAVWGYEESSYVYLPGGGPDTARDLLNIVPSGLLYPPTYLGAVIFFPLSALWGINTRANLLEASNIRDEAALDRYTFTREAYLQKREHLINDGDVPPEEYGDLFEEDLDECEVAATC